MEKIVFNPNLPQTLALKFPTGKVFPSKFPGGEDQTMYTCTDERVMFHSPYVAARIAALNLQPGEPFRMCRKETKVNGERKTEWQIERIIPGQAQALNSQPAPAPTIMATIQNAPNGLSPQHTKPVPVKLPMDQAMTQFLIAAGRSTRSAETTLGADGGSVRFDSRDIAALATTMFIAYHRDGWLTAMQPTEAVAPEAPIDIGPHQINTKAAADYVRDRKLVELRSSAKPWKTSGEFLAIMELLREKVGEVRFNEELDLAGVASPRDFSTTEAGKRDALAFYNRLNLLVETEAIQ